MAGDEERSIIKQDKGSNTSRTTEPWENSNHPLFLHHSDQPGVVLVSQPLMEDNYTTWAQSMNMALTIKNKKGFIDGTLKRPVHNADEQNQWDQCNTLVKTWLLAAMSKENQSSVVHCKEAQGMWLELQERFSQTNTVLLFNIENAIHGCEQGSSSVNSFFTKLKGLWDEKDALCSFPPCTCEAATEVKTFIETQKTMKFLMGLNDTFAQTRSTIIGMDPLPNLNKAYAMVLHQEKQAETIANKSTISSESSAFAVKRVNKGYSPKEGENRTFNPSAGPSKFCEKCGMNNHTAQYCRAHLKCTYCEGKGHTYAYCRKRKNDTAPAADGQIRSKANHVEAQKDDKEATSVNFPFTREECQHLLNQLITQTKPASANLVGNIPNYEELSGPTIGEDDWDGN